MRKDARLMDMRREMGCARYYAWRISCTMRKWQKGHGTVLSERLDGAVSALAYGMADYISWLHKKGLKMALKGLVAALLVSGLISACSGPDHGTYARLMSVVDIYGDGTVTLVTASGLRYDTDLLDGDVSLGECYSCIMDDAGTPDLVLDDVIISMRYERPDLLPQ